MISDMLHSQSLFPVLCVIRTVFSVIRAEKNWALKAALFLMEKGSAHLALWLKPVSGAERKRRLILCITQATGPSHPFQFQWWRARSSDGARKGPNLEGGLGRLLHYLFHTHPPLLLSYPFFSSLLFLCFSKEKTNRFTCKQLLQAKRPLGLMFGWLMVIWGVAVGLTKCLFFFSLSLDSSPPFLSPSL